jgi:ABC-type phosphate transport system permease subunit
MTLKSLGWLTPFVLPVTGCILFSAAAFVIALPLGLAMAGVGAFFMEWRIDAERTKR